MKRMYYYLVSSLTELILDSGKKPISIGDFINLCSEELACYDFDNLKKLFLFNDLRNAVNSDNKEYQYMIPSYYSEEEFKEGMSDTDSFLSFLAEYFYNKKKDKRLYPDLMEIDEAVLLFYLNLDENSPMGLRSLKVFLEFAESGKLPLPSCS